uniref:WD_REPEATS_REGION domain-containing protein n=1 Tax=Meloidogyne hapla TaxID=6305 RepID=A0A1I8BKA3_MELHA
MSAVDNKNSEEIAKPQCSSGNCDGADLLSLQERSNKDDSLPPEPKKLKRNLTLKYEQVYLRAIPKASQYEKSFMHRDIITHVLATEKDFIITASQDGHLKFWKKKKHNEGIEFVKHFRCHLKEFSDITVNHNGSLIATCCTQDRSVKVFDVVNFDMINMFKFEFNPKIVCFVHQGSDLVNALAVSDANSGNIIIVDSNGNNEPICLLDKLHQRPVILISVD